MKAAFKKALEVIAEKGPGYLLLITVVGFVGCGLGEWHRHDRKHAADSFATALAYVCSFIWFMNARHARKMARSTMELNEDLLGLCNKLHRQRQEEGESWKDAQ